MKKTLLLFTAVLCFFGANAQLEKCATMPSLNYHESKDPFLDQKLKKVEVDAQEWLRKNPDVGSRSIPLLTIPVVVHVVYKSAAQNIPDSQVVSQIQVLNEDYRKLNSNYTQTRAVFDTISADIQVEFCLASVDPDGNPTNGITRTASTASFDPILNFDKVKSSATGGKDPWPSSRYLNIWVCDMSIFNQVFVLGYAQFPGEDSLTDGVVIQYQHFGRVNYPSSAPANLGRTSTHEVGHWLGMRHIWGDDQACDSTDYVYDTPNCGDNSATTCVPSNNSCNDSAAGYWLTDVPDMIENYMDYSTDECMTMFTKGQKARMWSFLNTARTGLFTSNGCGSASGLAKQLEPEINFNCYPNPSSTLLNLSFENVSGKSSLEMFDRLGQQVRNFEIRSGVKETKIDVSYLENGLYLLRLNTIKGSQTKKIFVER